MDNDGRAATKEESLSCAGHRPVSPSSWEMEKRWRVQSQPRLQNELKTSLGNQKGKGGEEKGREVGRRRGKGKMEYLI